MKKLTKSRENRVIAGVLGGIAEYVDVDPVIVRLVYLAAMLVTAVAPGVVFYILAALIMPNAPHNAPRVYDVRDDAKSV